MRRRLGLLAVLMLAAVLLTGCSGSRATGKNSDQDKPKPVNDK